MGKYETLNEEKAAQYAKSVSGIFSSDAKLISKEIGDGNINWVFHIKDELTGKSIIFKQALPHVRVVESWPLTLDRSRIEAEAMKLQDSICPGMVPKVYFNDQDMALLMVEDLSRLEIMRFELMKMRKYPNFPKQIAKFLSRTIFYTSDIALDPLKKKEQVKKFSNPELCKIVEDLVFTDPFFDAPSNNINPELLSTVREFWKKKDLNLEVTKLKEIYMSKAQSLIHGDLHTGSIFIGQDELKAFDAEFSFYGPAGYDIGLVIANLLLNYASWEGRDDIPGEVKKDYREYLLDTIDELYYEFEKQFGEVWDKDARKEFAKIEGYKEYYLSTLFKESVGFAGCEVLRRVFGLAHVPDLDMIQDLRQRARAQQMALVIGEKMVMLRNKLFSIRDLTGLVRELAYQNMGCDDIFKNA
jgi:5-methylthioribose kinase